MLSDLRLYFVSVLQNISVSISVLLNEIIYISVSVSINEYNTDCDTFFGHRCSDSDHVMVPFKLPFYVYYFFTFTYQRVS